MHPLTFVSTPHFFRLRLRRLWLWMSTYSNDGQSLQSRSTSLGQAASGDRTTLRRLRDALMSTLESSGGESLTSSEANASRREAVWVMDTCDRTVVDTRSMMSHSDTAMVVKAQCGASRMTQRFNASEQVTGRS